MSYHISAFYYFTPVENPEALKQELEEIAQRLKLCGLVILGPEGINSTLAAPTPEASQEIKNWIMSTFKKPDLLFKDSKCESAPFARFSVKIRSEIVTLKTPELTPDMRANHHLSPEEWDRVLKEEDILLIDTRNWYEYNIGPFKGAVNPKIDQFTEFPEWIEQQNYDKNKKMLIFCTGGIRCEKGILEMQRRGFNNVYQLEGGILNYLEKKPGDQFQGECFVFDHRVAVDQNLQPSKRYKLCPHCGQPAEVKIDCGRCDSEAFVCVDCLKKPYVAETCSKNCAYHFERFPGKKGQKQVIHRQA
jgi:UPF0176 protein